MALATLRMSVLEIGMRMILDEFSNVFGPFGAW
jgi:hypothetical protein